MNEAIIKEAGVLHNLWVEGSDDAQLVYHLLKHYRLDKVLNVESKNGVENILKILKQTLKVNELKKLGVIVDVDDNLDQRWRSFSALLNDAGYKSIPTMPDINGTILTQGGLPDIGVWLMPDNQMMGMVEHFVSAWIPPGDVLWPMAGEAVQKVMEVKCNFAQFHQKKAEIHTWLAWQEEPGKPMGQAITKRYLDANAPHAQKLIAWLRNLFALHDQ